jgi:GntR family transcriptional regulator
LVRKLDETRDRVMGLVDALGVGRAIPSERRLSQDLGVSRLTVRAALDELVREGLLERRQGSGTFVIQPKIAQQLTLTSFSEDMRRRGMVPGSRTLALTAGPAGARLGRRLHVSPEERIVRITRLRTADGQPMAVETLHVPERLVPGLQQQDLEGGSFYELLDSRYGIRLGSGTQTIEPTVTNEEESDALGVPLHSPAFLFERTSSSEAGQVVEYVQSVYRGDRYQLVVELIPQRPRSARPPGADRPDGARRGG